MARSRLGVRRIRGGAGLFLSLSSLLETDDNNKTPRSKNFLSLERISQIHDGPMSAAATADTTTAISESTFRIDAFLALVFPFSDEAHQHNDHFLNTTPREEWQSYYKETDQALRMLSITESS